MKRLTALLVAALVLTLARAQIPSLGFCPEYLPMSEFDIERFTGVWYEAERYFQLTEVASRCVMSNYTRTPDNKYYVINEVMSRFTGIKRVLEGEIKNPLKQVKTGKLQVKYTSVPLIPLETQYNVLKTDYDTYAVLWSCAGVGPVHTQNAWIMTRERLPPADVIQKAYAVLDQYKISKMFFVKTNQEDCAYLDSLDAGTTPKPIEQQPAKQTASASASAASEAIVEELAIDNEEEASQKKVELPDVMQLRKRVHITPDAPNVIIQTRISEIAAKEKLAKEKAAAIKEPAIKQPIVEAADPVIERAAEQVDEAVKSVPEVIMKIADQAKEPLKEPVKEEQKEEPIKAAEPKPEEQAAAPAIAEEAKEAAPIEKEPAKEAMKEPLKEPLKEPMKEPLKEAKPEEAKPEAAKA